jgi:hypothetical protein
MLVVVGAAGIVSARWEFAAVYGIDPSTWSSDTQATMLNQYRFLKSVELGAGVFCLAYRRAIMDGGRAAAVFLTIVGLGVAARSFAWLSTGVRRPHSSSSSCSRRSSSLPLSCI